MIDTIKDINMGTTNSAPVPTENMRRRVHRPSASAIRSTG